MEFHSFDRYLTSKRTVDDHALNRHVWDALSSRLAAVEGRPVLDVLELGGGVGTMFQRLVEWGALTQASYTLVDSEGQNASTGANLLTAWARRQGLSVEQTGALLHLSGEQSWFEVQFNTQEVFEFFREWSGRRQWDLIVAHAFLDLVDVPAALREIRQIVRTGGLIYLTINFDGLTALEPEIDAQLDRQIIDLYHQTMEERTPNGSRTGRKMFNWLQEAGLRLVEAGSSDWVVYAHEGRYPADEAYFLRYILHFFEESLTGRPELSSRALAAWLEQRRAQVESGELVFVAHQMDFLVEVP